MSNDNNKTPATESYKPKKDNVHKYSKKPPNKPNPNPNYKPPAFKKTDK